MLADGWLREFDAEMSEPATTSRDVVEVLYSRALMLTDEVGSAFDAARNPSSGLAGDEAFALVTEHVRTTMLLAHATRWLLNCRAALWRDDPLLLGGRSTPLVIAFTTADTEWLALLPRDLASLVREVERFCLQLIRLDQAFRQSPALPSAEQCSGSNVVYLSDRTAAVVRAPAAKTA